MTEDPKRQAVLSAMAVGQMAERIAHKKIKPETVEDLTEGFLGAFLAVLLHVDSTITAGEMNEAFQFHIERKKTNDQAG